MILAIVTLLIAMSSIQFGASLAKQLFPVLGAQGTTALRILFAALAMGALLRPWRRRLNRREGKVLLLYGLSLGLMNLFFYLALHRIPLGIAVALEFTGPLFISLWASQRKSDWLWAALAIAGILLILPIPFAGSKLGSVDFLGVVFALVAGAFWALYILFGQKVSVALPGGVAASYGMFVAALAVFPFGLADRGWDLFQPAHLPLAFAVAILSSAIPYTLEMISLRTLPAKTFGILMSLEPAIAALSGFLFLAEKLSWLQWLAIVAVIIASLGSTVSSRGEPKAGAEKVV